MNGCGKIISVSIGGNGGNTMCGNWGLCRDCQKKESERGMTSYQLMDQIFKKELRNKK